MRCSGQSSRAVLLDRAARPASGVEMLVFWLPQRREVRGHGPDVLSAHYADDDQLHGMTPQLLCVLNTAPDAN